MEYLINHLQDYRDKINDFNVTKAVLYTGGQETERFSSEFRELIAIEIFGFVAENNKLLKDEFYRRFRYFKNLSKDNEFIKLQDDLFSTIVDIVNLIDIKTLRKHPNYEIRNGLCVPRKELLSTFEFFKAVKNKNNYYRLKHQDNYCYSAYKGAVSIYTNAEIIRKQYESVEFFLGILDESAKINDKSDKEYDKLRSKFKILYNLLLEKIYKIPKQIHTEQFEEFYTFCTGSTDSCNEVSYKINRAFYYKNNEEKNRKIKKIASTVIDDLIFFLQQGVARSQITDKKGLPIKKTEIFFSDEKGLYIDEKLNYPIRRTRAKLIKALKDGKKDGKILAKLWKSDNLQQLSKDIGEINNLFMKRLKLKQEIIISIPTGGYKLNNEDYEIIFTN